MYGLQLGDVKDASQTYDKAVKQMGGDAPGLYKLMGQLARHSTVPGSGVSVASLESSLANAERLPASKVDELEEAAAGLCMTASCQPLLEDTFAWKCKSLVGKHGTQSCDWVIALSARF